MMALQQMQASPTQSTAVPQSRFVWVASAFMLGGAMILLPHGRLDEYGTVPWFLLGAAVMLCGFILAMRHPPGDWRLLAAVAILVRFLLLFQAPGGDIYRYLWEGKILAAGWNPYLHAPSAAVLEPLRDGIWTSVHHKSFTAIYPPLAEWIFAGMTSLWQTPVFFKAVFLLADLVVVWLLVKRFGPRRSLLYAWNPLIIYSFAGGGHYDSLFILAIVLGWLAWSDAKKIPAVAWLGVAVAVKWLALPLLAYAMWRIVLEGYRPRQWQRIAAAALAGALPLTLSYIALSFWTGEWTLQLHPPKFSQHARSAEFLPALTGWLWEGSKFQNQWVLFPLAAGWAWMILRGRDFARTAEALFFLALILTPMLHAWYFTWIIPFAVLTRNCGTVAVTVSGFIYFMLHHHVNAPDGMWLLRPWEAALLWLPFVGGFLWSAWPLRERRQD